MTGSMTTWARLILVVTLVAAAFLVAPIADAATCAPEPPVAHTLAAHDPGEGDHNGIDIGDGICAHGHCHHNGTARSEGDDSLTLHPHARPVHTFPSNDRPASVSPDGLKRPPRV